MSKMNDIFQVDYLPDEKKIKINLWLPRKHTRNIILQNEKEPLPKQECNP